ncbi:hypothetical protein B0H10DRAFT_1642182, partial [Mycena sp. CBHHK59/15]
FEQDIQCTVNVQHNCADNPCRVERSRMVFQEREETSERVLAVHHSYNSTTDWVMNTGQMRDAAVLE